MKDSLYRLYLSVPAAGVDRVQGLLASEAPWGWEEKILDNGLTLFGVHSEDRGHLSKIADSARRISPDVAAEIEMMERRDWQSAWREFFTPVEAGRRFVVLPPWLAHLEHARRMEIVIEPKSAFGTGHHASTRLCLAALSELLDEKRLHRGEWFLDLGCGTGVLGIAAVKSGMNGTGLDIDPLAIANSRENRELNEADGLELLKGGIEKIRGEKYDLVMANILSEPLIDMAAQIVAAMKKDGCLILGGILDSQAEAVAAAYRQQGLGEPLLLAEDEWRVLVWK